MLKGKGIVRPQAELERGWHIIGEDKNVENKYKKSCLKSRAMTNCRGFNCLFNCCIFFGVDNLWYFKSKEM